jgi:hypothetical protein
MRRQSSPGDAGGTALRPHVGPALLLQFHDPDHAGLHVWGPDSYNNGAGMTRLLTAAAFAMNNMPFGTVFNAYDVAAYINSHKRPEKANLEKDFPVRLQKPIDTPYGPYADGFSLEQHKIGPFEPIRAKVQELTTMSRTVKAGEPGNGSSESDRAR